MTTLKGHPDVPAGTALNVRLIWDVPLQGAGRGLSPKHRDATYDWSTGKYMDGQAELTFPHPRAGQNDNALRGPLVAVYTIGTGPLSQTARYPLQAYETAPGELDITVDPNPATVVAAQTLIDLIADADVARTQAEEAAQRVNDAILDLEAERQAVADIIADTAQATDEARTEVDRLRLVNDVGTADIALLLRQWTQAEAYEPTAITRDADGLVTSATVKWPDGSAGTLTAMNYSATHGVYDGYTITHAASGKTVTQAAVTRDSNGAVTVKPALGVN